MGVYNPDKSENSAFIEFTRHFLGKGLNVPEIYAQNPEQNIYLQKDLGDITLFSHLTAVRNDDSFPPELTKIYKRVIDELPKFQVLGGKGLNYDYCYPRAGFDKQSMMWDMNYFKYYFLKLAKIPFDEQKLEDDFLAFADYLLEAPDNFFLYRDFQSRNIMLCNDTPYFIDYQGGRKGALQYDIASLLYDAKANIPQDVRIELLNYYMDAVSKHVKIKKKEFTEYYYGYVLVRIMQALGAYGFRGYYEKKEHFLLSIPYAIKNLQWIFLHVTLPVKLTTIMDVLFRLTTAEDLKKFGVIEPKKPLTVQINSFSYKKGIPADASGNGGGYVFDCRGLHNPGRFKEYQGLTGKDREVAEFLHNEKSTGEFLKNVCSMVGLTVGNYLERNFTHLMVNFGCTGGQHRSVYCAEMLSNYLNNNFNINIELHHTELSK